jgi:hypothetical protein
MLIPPFHDRQGEEIPLNLASVRTAAVPIRNRTNYLPNTSVERYRYTSLLHGPTTSITFSKVLLSEINRIKVRTEATASQLKNVGSQNIDSHRYQDAISFPVIQSVGISAHSLYQAAENVHRIRYHSVKVNGKVVPVINYLSTTS